MTLNIGLEEVPFAILEAVKARIMANRRKLQDQQQSQPGGPLDQPQWLRPSLRPKPQFIKQGASTKAWRPPRQGAVVLDDYKSVIIKWDGLMSSINDPGATLYYDYAYHVNITPSDINGVPAIASASAEFSGGGAVYQISNYPKGASDFTLEAWGQCPVGGLENVASGFYILLLQNKPELSLRMELQAVYRPRGFYIPGDDLYDIAPGFYITPFLSMVPEFNQFSVPESATAPYNLCIQRIRKTYYYYINGRLLYTSPQITASTHDFVDSLPVYVYIISQSLGAAGNKISQLRLTPNRARYPQAGFTPDPLPFRP